MTVFDTDEQIVNDNFYRRNYTKLLSLMFLLCISALGMTFGLLYSSLKTQKVDYYATSTDGRVVSMHSLAEPILSSQYILKWAANVSRQIYSLNFSTLSDQLLQAPDKFTKNGWNDFVSSLKSSGTLASITKDKLIASAVQSAPGVILRKGVFMGHYTWNVQIPMLVTYSGAGGTSTAIHKQIVLTLFIERVPAMVASQGIQVGMVSVSGSPNNSSSEL